MTDPWIVDGKLHPAVEVMGLPEWEWVAGTGYRLCYTDGEWWVDFGPISKTVRHLIRQISTPEAHALLEKQAREWLREHDALWRVVWHRGNGEYGVHLPNQGFVMMYKGGEDAALIAAVLAAKEKGET